MPATACTSVPVNISNTTTSITNNNATTNYEWIITPATGFSFTNSTTNTSANPEITFTTANTYTVTLKATKTYGGFCRISKTIIVGNKGTINLKTTNDTTICPGDTVLVKVGGLKTYSFTPNTNVSVYNDSNAYVYPTSATNYMIIGSISGGCFDTTFVDVKMKAAPAYTMTGKPTICAGDSVTISFTGVDTAFWTPNTNTSFITETSRRVFPTTSTSYNIRLVKPTLCDIKLIIPVKVLTKPVYNLSKTGTQNICAGDSIDINEVNNIPNIVWAPATNVYPISGNNFRFKPLLNTKYIISTNDTGYCTSIMDSVLINVVAKPVVIISGGTAVCGGASLSLIAKGATTYSWSPNLYLSATNKDTVLSTPINTITYQVSGSNGTCSSIATHTINVGTNSVKIAIVGKTDVCYGSTVKLIAKGALTYKWSPASLVSNEFSDTVRISTLTSTSILLKGESTGCKDSLLIPIIIHPTPTVTATLDNTNAICAGFKKSVIGSGAASYYIDPLYNVTKLKNDSFILKPSQTTKYFMYGVSTKGCQGKDSFEINVNPLPVITINPATTTINKGDSINITASGGSSYLWTPTTFIRTANNLATIRVKPDSTILYNLKVTTAAGCVGNGVAIVYILNKPILNGIQSSDLENIIIYPNPSSDYINVESTELVKASIYNMAGAQIYNNELYSSTLELDIREIAAGSYMLILESKAGTRKMTKIEISK
jgi:Secretion system C-terminal sorting domain